MTPGRPSSASAERRGSAARSSPAELASIAGASGEPRSAASTHTRSRGSRSLRRSSSTRTPSSRSGEARQRERGRARARRGGQAAREPAPRTRRTGQLGRRARRGARARRSLAGATSSAPRSGSGTTSSATTRRRSRRCCGSSSSPTTRRRERGFDGLGAGAEAGHGGARPEPVAPLLILRRIARGPARRRPLLLERLPGRGVAPAPTARGRLRGALRVPGRPNGRLRASAPR